MSRWQVWSWQVWSWQVWRWFGPVLVLGIGFLYTWKGRQYPWQFALLVGLAVGSLVYTAIRVAETMLLLWRSLADEPPGEESEGQQQKEVGKPAQR